METCNRKSSPLWLFPLTESMSAWDAFTEENTIGGTVELSTYEARVILEHYLTHMIEMETEWEFYKTASATVERHLSRLEERLHRLIDAGLLTLDEVKARYTRARELRGFLCNGESSSDDTDLETSSDSKGIAADGRILK